MSFPSPTTGLGVAAKIAVQGNEGTSTKPGYNNVVLSVGGTNGQTTFQLNPQLQDAAGNEVELGTAFVVASVASSSPGPLTLTGVTASVNGAAAYAGTITGGGSNALVGQLFTVTGFVGANNNGTFICTASSVSVLTLANAAATTESASAKADSEVGTAVYTGTFTGATTGSLVGETVTIAGFVTHTSNNGTFIITANTGTTTITVENNAAVAETASATATIQELTNVLTYVAYPAKTDQRNTYNPSGVSEHVATVSATGLITAVAPGGIEVEVSYPTFNNSVGDVVSSGNIMNGLPIMKIYATVNVQVLP